MKSNNKFRNWWQNFKRWKRNTTKIKYIFLVYFLIVLVGSLILFFPWTHNTSSSMKLDFNGYTDALFTTASAFSDTGLVTVTTQSNWNMFGQAVIATLIFIGGIGFFALKIFIINYIFHIGNFDLNKRELLNTERGDDSFQSSKLVINSIKFIIIVVISGGLILSCYFYFIPPSSSIVNAANPSDKIAYLPENPVGNLSLAFRFGFFHSISALNNAGFDIMGNGSLIPYYNNTGLQAIIIVLFIIGGIGYPVIYDFTRYLKVKIRNPKTKFKWSLITKISTLTYLIVTILGFSVTLAFEWGGNSVFWQKPEYGNTWTKIWAILFTSFSTRSAGFTTVNLNDFSQASLTIFAVQMFIGAAPASTGGGIRTTTLAIVMVSIISKMIGHQSTRMHKRKIKDDTVKMAGNVFIISLVIVIIGTLILHTSLTTYSNFGGSLDENKYNSAHLLFEVASAFGTTGLTGGITPNLNAVSKYTLIFIMFIGQFGVSSTILVWKNRSTSSNKYEFLEEDIAIG